MTVEQLVQNDINDIMEIEKNVFSNPWKKEEFEFMLLNSSYNFVLKEKLEIIGYFCSLITNKILHITNFAVTKKYQNRGIGHIFLKTIIELLIGYGHRNFFLEVRESNKKAIHLYEKLDFKVVDFVQNYYHNPDENALIMVKTS